MAPESAGAPRSPDGALIACALLVAASADLLTALALGTCCLLALLLAAPLRTLLHRNPADAADLPAGALLCGGAVVACELGLQATWPAWHAAVGTFLPLAALAAALLLPGQATSRAALRSVAATGGALLIVLVVLGGVREALGHGTVFGGAGDRLGLPGLELRLTTHAALPLVATPAGALLLLGLALAGRAAWHRSRKGSA